MNKIEWVIFDLDGTLANSMALIVDIYNQDIAEKFNCKKVDKTRVDEYRMRPPTEFFREFGITPLKFPFILFRAKRLMKARKEEIEIFSGIPELIATLHQQGIRLGVVTSNSTQNARDFLERYRLIQYFDFIQGSRLLQKKDKKLRRILKKYDLAKERILYIGDEVRDIVACKKVGLQCGAVTWGQAHRLLLEQHHPDFILEQPKEILSALEKQKH